MLIGMKLDAPRQHLQRLAEASGQTLKSLSVDVLGKNHAYLQQYVNRGTPRELPETARESLAEHFGVPADSFRLDKYRRKSAQMHLDNPAMPDDELTKGKSVVSMFEVDVRASAGAGSVVDQEEESAVWAFPEYWVRAELSARSGRDFRIITIEGDSMVSEPAVSRDLQPGDKVIINIADRLPSPPGVFIVHDGLGLVAKRVEHIAQSEPPSIRISSNNPAYSAYERTLDEAHIMGRVVGRWQRL